MRPAFWHVCAVFAFLITSFTLILYTRQPLGLLGAPLDEKASHKQKVWLVTGCSSGIGKEVVKAVLARGDLAVATARNTSRLAKLQDLGAKALQLDATDGFEQLGEVVQAAVSFYGRIDVLVQAAGIGQYNPVEEMNDVLTQQIYHTNTLGAVRLVRAILPHWRELGFGDHLVISSLNAMSGQAGFSAYSASKAALNRSIESLNDETEPLNFVRNLIIEPGLFRTSLDSKLRFPTNSSHYQWLADETRDEVNQTLGKQPGDPAKLATIVVDMVRGEGVAKGKTPPLVLPLGKDSFDEVKEHAERTLKMLREWEHVIKSTDFKS